MIDKRERVVRTFNALHPASMALAVLALVLSWAVLPPEAEAQGVEDGQALFQRRCSGCHALDADHEGPRLRGVVGRAAGSVKTFQYSDALKNAKHTWDEANLDKWLTDTESVVPDNDMSFRVPKQEERVAIISYLKSLSTP
ncbi:MAG: cytochrome c class [Bryobacterales bacterium]|nr:cytochrome c class [Bryobacterales bacterium]